MSLKQWADNGWLRPHDTSAQRDRRSAGDRGTRPRGCRGRHLRRLAIRYCLQCGAETLHDFALCLSLPTREGLATLPHDCRLATEWDEVTSWEIALLRRFQLNRLIIRRFPRIVFKRAERTFLPPGTSLPPDLRNDLWGGFKRAEVRKFISRMCAGYQATLPRLPELYFRVTCPTLILWGENDKHSPPAHGERLHRAISGSQLSIVPQAEHWMVWYLAKDVASAIKSFQS